MDILTRIKPVPQKATQGEKKVLLGEAGSPAFCISADNCKGKLSKNALALLTKKLLAAIGGSLNTEAKTVIRVSITTNVPAAIEKNSKHCIPEFTVVI